jgi:hypothetical protein
MDWGNVVSVAVAVVGLLQWFKGLFKKAPAWMWAVASAVGCMGVAATVFYLPPWVLMGLVALAVAQLGYETIVKFILSKIPVAIVVPDTTIVP